MLAYSWRALKHDLIRRGSDIQKYAMKYSVNARGIVMGENFSSEDFYSNRQLCRVETHSFYDIFTPFISRVLISLFLFEVHVSLNNVI